MKTSILAADAGVPAKCVPATISGQAIYALHCFNKSKF
jgi:hypothetical protein